MRQQNKYALALVAFWLTLAVPACSLGTAPASSPAPAPSATTQTQASLVPPPTATAQPLASATSVPAASVPPTSGDARQAMIEAFMNLDHAYPFRLTETDSAGSCTQMVHQAEFASRTEWHATWSGCQQGEAISKGGQTYYLVNGTWTTGVNPLSLQQQIDITALILASLQNVQAAGSEMLNGVDTSVYTFDLNNPIISVTGARAWIGAVGGLPLQVQAQFTMSGIAGNTKIVYEYGIPVTIQAPMP